MMLIELAREGFTHLTGVDYSDLAIELSERIAKDQAISIDYRVADLLNPECCISLGRFDIVHDKGFPYHSTRFQFSFCIILMNVIQEHTMQ